MRAIPAVAASAGVAFAFCGLNASALAADDAMAIASAATSKYEQATASKDAAKIAELFTEDAVFQIPAGMFKGREAIQQHRESSIKSGAQKEDISVAGARRIGDVVYDYGEVTLHIKSQSETKDLKLHWGAVLTRSGDDWKIALLTATPEAPPKTQ